MRPIINKEQSHDEKKGYHNFFVPASCFNAIGATTLTGDKGEDAAGV
jgi:hypothetical protein